MRRRWSILLVTVGLVGILVAVHVWRLPRGALVVDFLNVDQGDAVLITTPDAQTILVDGGPDQLVLEQLGAVLPFLHRRIDLMVLTHPHADHMMGLVQVLKRYEVGAVLFSGVNSFSPIYDEFLLEIQRHGIPLHVAHGEEDWKFVPEVEGVQLWDGSIEEGLAGTVFLDVLFPFDPLLGQTIDNVNNASVVIKLIYGDHGILLTGDAELGVEAELVASDLDLSANILKAGHHGSRTSSAWDFLERVQPEVVVISCGVDNEFGHPHKETLEKLQDLDAEVRRTDLEGRITIRLTDP